jgi:hypothetical protein
MKVAIKRSSLKISSSILMDSTSEKIMAPILNDGMEINEMNFFIIFFAPSCRRLSGSFSLSVFQIFYEKLMDWMNLWQPSMFMFVLPLFYLEPGKKIKLIFSLICC